ncbi:thiamine pyrophosphate-dependent enzyme [Ferrovibrio sp. MS7]|uniref:thiamine pyrophosphate-dependent enzyme n=1 Tax=Ferrovibrio plantarum TaxID=3119164 RepID=UPI003134E772
MTSKTKATHPQAMTPGAPQAMTTAEAVVEQIIRNGIDTIYALPGVQNDYLFDAFAGATDRLRFIHTRHEQGAAYMALGAALATGKPQVFTVVPGPGILNATAAICTAYALNAPVLALTGQISSNAIGRGLGLLHEIPDQLGLLRSLTKWADRIHAPHEGPAKVNEAFAQMQSGRPRPVALECPLDVWPRRAPVELLPAGEALTAPIDLDAVKAAAKLLAGAERPLIIVGGGALDAGESLREVAEILQAPVSSHRTGRGALDSRHPLSVNSAIGHRFWGNADVVLAVGTRLQLQQLQWGLDDKIKIVRIDADADELNRVRAATVGIVGDARLALQALASELGKIAAKRASRADEVQQVRALSDADWARCQPQMAFLDAIRAELPEDGIFVDELTQLGYVSRLHFPIYKPRTFITPGYQGTLGWGLATAMGVKAAMPDKAVVAVSGDGGFMFNVQEIATAVQHRIPVVVVLMNDGAFGNVLRTQTEDFGNRRIATNLNNPDFVKLAESFGALGLRAKTPEELRAALRQGLKSGLPTIIDVPVGPMPSPWNVLRFGRSRP